MSKVVHPVIKLVRLPLTAFSQSLFCISVRLATLLAFASFASHFAASA